MSLLYEYMLMKQGLSQDAGVNYPPGFLISITGGGGGSYPSSHWARHSQSWSQDRDRTHTVRTHLETIPSLQSA